MALTLGSRSPAGRSVPGPPPASPGAWLSVLAKRLHTTPELVPSPRATEELIVWLEAMASAGVTISTLENDSREILICSLIFKG
jgi:hypothetical protein